MADFHEIFSPKLNHFLLYFKSFFYTLHVVKFTVSELYSVGGEVIVDVNAQGGKGSGGRSRSLVNRGNSGVSGPEALFFSSGGPSNVSIFYWKIVARSSSPMTGFVKIPMFQCDDAPLFRVANFMGFRTVVVPMFPIRTTILTAMPFGFPGKFAEARR